ncbi:MAG: tRNA (adenosine(37)-N6)-dimethylallyltransferase MiaA [Leptolyngbyaceae cyanobacterium RU_5_1]|nr:tRNA (adenosine(37)-N6)-dimethylallyltransferase MiaA [Leptolyngbyaceae cyanobacterium RU_5_1]
MSFSISSLTNSNNTCVPGLIVICGATATGKSNLAIALAKRLNSAILSADSRQVYREFNIGTAKPAIADQQHVPHYLIDLCDPTETFTVAEYQQQAQELIEKLHQGPGKGLGARDWGLGKDREMGKWGDGETAEQSSIFNLQSSISSPLPLLVGGTGLYIRAITRGMKIPRVSPQPELRSQLESLGQSQCYAILQQVDSESAVKIHPHDQVRTVRSLEVFYTTGYPMSKQQGENPPTYPILQIGLDCQTPAHLQQRIEHRTQHMVASGFVDEVDYLCQKYGTDLPLLNTLGYAEFKQHLTGKLSLAAAQELTVLHTRQFAKRQRTWFRACPIIEWFDADSSNLVNRVGQRVEGFLHGSCHSEFPTILP